jgi:biofilm PGA synthesis N-glycosyltransferase PgaC
VTTSVSVGVCAYNEERRVPRLLESVVSQSLPVAYELREILVVASGCTDRTEARVVEARARDPRVRLIREPVRRGKASAINILLEESTGDILVLVNADAALNPGSLEHLLGAFEEDAETQVACGSVVLEDGHRGLQNVLEEMQWRIHNRSLETLSDLRMDNHCCDEFMAIRRGFLTALPPNLINDGAYIGVAAALRGSSVRFRPGAEVRIETPRTVRGLLQQRVRVLRGHRQVRRLLGRTPSTIEGLATRRPDLVVKLLGGAFRDRPSSILPFLAVALPVEVYANVLAFLQDVATDHYEAVWVPVE